MSNHVGRGRSFLTDTKVQRQAAASQLIPARQFHEWHPLDLVPAPDWIPDRWDGPHAGKRLIEALRTLALMPMSRGPRTFHNAWPGYCHDWADLLAQCEAEEAEKEQDRRQQNRTRILPSSREIAHMETAIRWPGQYLREYPQLLKVCGAVALSRSRDRDYHHPARRLHLPPHLVRRWNREGLDMIAAGLRRDQVPVF